MVKYQGEDIDFQLAIDQVSPTSTAKWTDFADVKVYFYTHPKVTHKFSTSEESGYSPLSVSEDRRVLSGTITSQQSLTMCGTLYMDVMVVKNGDGGFKHAIRRVITGVEVLNTPIKEETLNNG